MQIKTGIPNTIKKINELLVREKFMGKKPLACAMIAAETGISITTVRSIMNEMFDRGEILSLGLLESSGGRRSEQFVINDDCYEGISICLTEDFLYISIIDIHARIISSEKLPFFPRQDVESTLIELIEARSRAKTRALGIGVPGIISADGFIQNTKDNSESIDFISELKKRFGLPIIMENDLNAAALGFAKEIGAESTLAYINFRDDSNHISAGYVDGRNIIRGMGTYAGELGLMPYDTKRDFCEALYSADEPRRAEIIARLIAWVCCVINPQQIVLNCDIDFKVNARKINKILAYHLPEKMMPKIIIGNNHEKYFMDGVALLTSTLLFDNDSIFYLPTA